MDQNFHQAYLRLFINCLMVLSSLNFKPEYSIIYTMEIQYQDLINGD